MSYTPPVGDATITRKGIIKLGGDLTGTADAPIVAALSDKNDAMQIDVDATLTANSDTKLASQKP